MGACNAQVRLVEGAVRGPGWGVPEEALRLLPGPAFEVEQATDDKGLPVERPITPPDKKSSPGEFRGVAPPCHHGAGCWLKYCRISQLHCNKRVSYTQALHWPCCFVQCAKTQLW